MSATGGTMDTEGSTEFELWNKGRWPQVDVVGEKFHEDAIRRLFPAGLAHGSGEFEGSAHLVPEPRNPHDRNAVSVRVRGATIGYLAKELAARYVTVLTSLASQGLAPVVPCRVWASQYDDWQGIDRKGRDIYVPVLNAQASIVLDEPHLCVPANLPPNTAHRVLPHGGALQVKGEEEHLDVLAPLVSEHGEAWTYASLHLLTVSSGRTEKRVVELRIDDQPIGQLTPAMSNNYAAVIEHLNDQDQLTVAKVLLKGNPLQVEAVLHAARSHELDATWLGTERRPHPGQSVAVPTAPDRTEPVPDPAARTVRLPFEVPPKPTSIVFCPPPGWPPAPEGWEPSPGWQPQADWPEPPADWDFWRVASLSRKQVN